MKKGDKLICSVQSADRDEEHFAHPDRFDIHRQIEPKDVLGFGWGPHRCQGEWLSRVELGNSGSCVLDSEDATWSRTGNIV